MAMAEVDPSVPWTSELLKDVYKYAISATCYRSVRYRLLSRGGNGPSDVPFNVEMVDNAMAKRVVWDLFYDDPGSAIVSDPTTRSFDGHGQRGITEGRFAYTGSRITFRTTADENEIQYMSNDATTMLNTTLRKLDALLFKCAHTMNSLFKYSGRHGQIGLVSSGGGAAVSGSGTNVSVTVTTKQVLDVPRGTSVIFRNADGTYLTNSVYGVVTNKSVKSGTGTLTVVFPTTGTGYTIPSLALICIYNASASQGATERTFFEGMPALVGNGAHPTASIGNNLSLTDPGYTSEVMTHNYKITSLALRSLLSRVKKTAASHGLETNVQMQGGQNPSFDANGYPLRQKFVWHMSESSQIKLETDFWNSGRTSGLQRHTQVSNGFMEGEAVDEGRRYPVFMGVPIINDDSATDDEIYLLNTGAFASGMLDAFVPYSHRMSGWNYMSGTEKYELVRQIRGLLAIVRRDACGKIVRTDGGIFGYTDDELAQLDPAA